MDKLSLKKYHIDKPAEFIAMSRTLKRYVVENNLFVPISGKNYVMVEGWQFAGGLIGLFPIIESVEKISDNEWMAKANIVNKQEKIVGTGFAMCSKKEYKKKSFDEYAILSMAQTRAIGKAYRNLIGWMMKLAGYEGTPAEEMKTYKQKADAQKREKKEVKTGKVEELKKMLKGQTDEEKIKDLASKGFKVQDFNITERHASVIIAQILNQ